MRTAKYARRSSPRRRDRPPTERHTDVGPEGALPLLLQQALDSQPLRHLPLVAITLALQTEGKAPSHAAPDAQLLARLGVAGGVRSRCSHMVTY